MRPFLVLTLALSPVALLACAAPARETGTADALRDELVTLERAALDRWIRADPDGYLDLYAPDVTYFDPQRDKRVDGIEAMQTLLAPMRGANLPMTDPRYEMIDPKVQASGDIAVLTFNLVSYGKLPDRPEGVLARWNSTEVYRRIDGAWKIIHSHWSYIKPDIKPPAM